MKWSVKQYASDSKMTISWHRFLIDILQILEMSNMRDDNTSSVYQIVVNAQQDIENSIKQNQVQRKGFLCMVKLNGDVIEVYNERLVKRTVIDPHNKKEYNEYEMKDILYLEIKKLKQS